MTFGFLLRVGVAAGLAAAGTNLLLLLLATWGGWDITAPGQASVDALPIVLVCLLAGGFGAVGAYIAARVTKRPEVWVVVVGAVLFLASINDLPRTLQAMHLVATLWVVGWLTRAVLRGSHLG